MLPARFGFLFVPLPKQSEVFCSQSSRFDWLIDWFVFSLDRAHYESTPARFKVSVVWFEWSYFTAKRLQLFYTHFLTRFIRASFMFIFFFWFVVVQCFGMSYISSTYVQTTYFGRLTSLYSTVYNWQSDVFCIWSVVCFPNYWFLL